MSGVLSSAERTSNGERGKKDKADKAEDSFCKKSFWLLLMKAYRITKPQESQVGSIISKARVCIRPFSDFIDILLA